MKIYITLLFVFLSIRGMSQVSFQFIPEIYGRNINGLFSCRLMNISGKRTASLVISVTERKGGAICVIRTPEFSILPGSNPIPVAAVSGAAVQFSKNRLGQITSASRSFPEGDYDYCFTLTYTHTDNPPDEQCFPYLLAPFAELSLIDPVNKDKICDKRPLLTWQPLLPGVPGANYQLVLAEIKSGQNPTEALNYNLPLINQSSIIAPVLPYPSIAKELESKKRYAWQVTAYKEHTILTRSEIWEFTVDCQDSIKKIKPDSGYRDIEDLLRGNYYVANGDIRISIINPYQKQKLKYSISSLENNGKRIGGLPKLELLNGTNKLIIDLSGNGAFQPGVYYILKLWLPNGAVKNLRFVYEQPKD
ncbi:DUF928 domain-containing protein [Mucilaginibacter sp. BJC16-A38]|uniref:DUF928 domain-containing protein n=1 Tax=Mucilaginibacter phenanthrenivorans TaxID=1234842 RepID=UPI002157EE4A|nr:DUF928 domain-containing protein [Mucilaginibacter phenanthrenivorans]MCR8558154.1 DUF928 domain-containing protein [Mucilaginibacter phenanthrenivorans]